MLKLIITLILIFYTSTASAEWKTEDTVRQLVITGLSYVDYTQTKTIAKSKGYYYEVNPILGKHPHVDTVNIFFALTKIANFAIAYYLPDNFRKVWQYSWISIETTAITWNWQAGIRMTFD